MLNNELKDLLVRGAAENQTVLNKEKTEKIEIFIDALKEWNEKINLTTITEDEEIVKKHIIDSLTCFKTNQLKSGIKMIDVGTGAGFPAIPLAIADETLEITLLDSLNKRLKYLDFVIDTLKLKKVKTLHARAEDAGQNKLYREAFDVVTARAVAPLSILLELCLPFLKDGGYFICMKGPGCSEEVTLAENALEKLGGIIIEVIDTPILGTDLSHNILLIKKTGIMPKQYPRKPGKATSHPL